MELAETNHGGTVFFGPSESAPLPDRNLERADAGDREDQAAQ